MGDIKHIWCVCSSRRAVPSRLGFTAAHSQILVAKQRGQLGIRSLIRSLDSNFDAAGYTGGLRNIMRSLWTWASSSLKYKCTNSCPPSPARLQQESRGIISDLLCWRQWKTWKPRQIGKVFKTSIAKLLNFWYSNHICCRLKQGRCYVNCIVVSANAYISTCLNKKIFCALRKKKKGERNNTHRRSL